MKKRKKSKQRRKRRADKNSELDSRQGISSQRTGLIWPWLASVTISGEVTCSAFIISSRIVVTVTKCFPTLQTAGAQSAAAIQALNNIKDEIVVIGQDEKV